MDGLEFTFVDELSDRTRELVLAPLRDFNQTHNATFWEARELPENAPRPLNVIATVERDRVIGGLLGETQFAWLKIALMAVEEGARLQGVGKRLLAEAEGEARHRGCRNSFVDTMDYQSPGFYQKLGYQIAGMLDDWDSHGHRKYFLYKRLA